MITQNFHIFVIVATLAVYIILKSYKSNDESSDNSNKSNLIYVLLTPIILYSGNYFLTKNTELTSTNNPSNNSSISEELLSIPYPVSSYSSF